MTYIEVRSSCSLSLFRSARVRMIDYLVASVRTVCRERAMVSAGVWTRVETEAALAE